MFFSYKKCQLWSTCSRYKICTLQHYWHVASTISSILISCTAKRRSCFFALCVLWNEAFYKMREDLEGQRSVCTMCAGAGRAPKYRFDISICHSCFGSQVPSAFFQSHWEQAGTTRQRTCWAGLHSPMLGLTSWQWISFIQYISINRTKKMPGEPW